jgi:hypothetical protein
VAVLLAWTVTTRTGCHCRQFGVLEHKFSESLKMIFSMFFCVILSVIQNVGQKRCDKC